jgi:hypothetical protein
VPLTLTEGRVSRASCWARATLQVMANPLAKSSEAWTTRKRSPSLMCRRSVFSA